MDRPTGKRGAAYVRVSDGDKQDPAAQRTMISTWAARKGLTISRWFEDITGRNPRDRADKRKEFQRLIKAVESGELDWVVVDSQDRFGTADSIELGYYLHIFRRHDVSLWSVDSSQGKAGLLSTADTAAIFSTTVKSVTSAEELKEYGKRQVSRKRERAARGEWQGGYVPYGYDVVCLNKSTGKEQWRVVVLKMIPTQKIWHRVIVHPDGRQERCDGENTFPRHQDWEVLKLAPSIIEERTKIVKEVFELFGSGAWSVRGLCDRLNKRQVDSVTGQGWYHTRLKPLLENPVYHHGQTVWGKVSHGKNAWYVGGEYLVPPKRQGRATMGRRNAVSDWVVPPADTALVEKTLFDQVQARLNGRPALKRGLRDDRLWLAGLLVCDRCNQRMTGWSQGGLNYACTTYRKFGKTNPAGCRLHRVRHDVIEGAVARYLDQIAPDVRALVACETESAMLGELFKQFFAAEDDVFDIRARIERWLVDQTGRELVAPWENVLAIYREVWDRQRGTTERELEAAKAELRNLIANMNRIPAEMAEAVEIQQQLIAEADERVKKIKDQLIPLDDQWRAARDSMAALERAVDDAQAAVAGDDARRKALAVRKVISSIRLKFKHFEHKTRDRRARTSGVERSTLDQLVILPVQGQEVTFDPEQAFTVDRGPGRG